MLIKLMSWVHQIQKFDTFLMKYHVLLDIEKLFHENFITFTPETQKESKKKKKHKRTHTRFHINEQDEVFLVQTRKNDTATWNVYEIRFISQFNKSGSFLKATEAFNSSIIFYMERKQNMDSYFSPVHHRKMNSKWPRARFELSTSRPFPYVNNFNIITPHTRISFLLNLNTHTHTNTNPLTHRYTYIYIFVCVCVCVRESAE